MTAIREGAGSIINVAIVDDHPVVLRGLQEIILRNFAPVNIALASTGHELLELVRNNPFDLIILDLSLPDMDGLDVLGEVKKGKRKTPVLVVSMYPEEEYGMRVLRSGACGYVTKRAVVNELVEAARKILSGGKYVSPALAEKILVDFESDTQKAPHERLSNREFQVMCMLGKGKTVREISETIHVSTNSVRTYRLRILEKTGLKRTNELIQYATAHGLGNGESNSLCDKS
ncbi:MAG TPA: response regulator transcription factor [Syntrophorhabdaceae bacterium]